MSEKKKVNAAEVICAVAIPLLAGIFSSALTSDAMKLYAAMEKPPLSPPGWLFPVVWTLLYLLMGLASYLVFKTPYKGSKAPAALLYFGQLVMNFFWALLFFRCRNYLLAFIWLMLMWVLIIACALRFRAVNRKAGLLMLPYILWTTFAAYLNLAAWLISRKI